MIDGTSRFRPICCKTSVYSTQEVTGHIPGSYLTWCTYLKCGLVLVVDDEANIPHRGRRTWRVQLSDALRHYRRYDFRRKTQHAGADCRKRDRFEFSLSGLRQHVVDELAKALHGSTTSETLHSRPTYIMVATYNHFRVRVHAQNGRARLRFPTAGQQRTTSFRWG